MYEIKIKTKKHAIRRALVTKLFKKNYSFIILELTTDPSTVVFTM